MKQFKRQGCSIMVGQVSEINSKFGIEGSDLEWSVLSGAKMLTLEANELRALADLLESQPVK